MKRVLLSSLVVLVLSLTAAAQVETWKVDPNHTASQFAVRHMGISTVRGQFKKTTGSITYDPKDPSKDAINVVIDAASVDTRIAMRDKDLRSPHFLDVEKFPTITFKSTRVEAAGPGKLKAIGDLTIHGVTKQVTLDVDGPTPPIKDPRGNERMGASATTRIDRKDFGVSADPGIVGDEITITIDTEMVKPAAAAPAQ